MGGGPRAGAVAGGRVGFAAGTVGFAVRFFSVVVVMGLTAVSFTFGVRVVFSVVFLTFGDDVVLALADLTLRFSSAPDGGDTACATVLVFKLDVFFPALPFPAFPVPPTGPKLTYPTAFRIPAGRSPEGGGNALGVKDGRDSVAGSGSVSGM